MSSIFRYLLSSSPRIVIIILSILAASVLSINISYLMVYLLNILILAGVALDLHNEYRSSLYSRNLVLFRLAVMILSLVFLYESSILFFKTAFLGGEASTAQTAIHTYLTYFYLLITSISLTNSSQIIKVFTILRSSPAVATIVSFSLVILIGAMLLTLPASLVAIDRVSFVDALFISASATCVTGLTTVDIGTYYTVFGQIIVMLLIQTGGIGIVTLALSLPILIDSQTTFTSAMTIKDITGVRSIREVLGIAKAVIISTFAIEIIGAVFLFLFDKGTDGIPFRVFSAIFHSVSAFCNAGFSLFSSNLQGYKENYPFIVTIIMLIITGGLGYPVILSLFQFMKNRIIFRKRYQLPFHSKIVLSTTSILILAGTILFLLLEWSGGLGSMGVSGRVVNALFQSVTPRTAGFNTIDFSLLNSSTILVVIVLMYIGASPSSTGGGIKTTTFATLLFSLRALIRNRGEVEAFKRTIPISSIYRALNVAFISLAIISTSIFFLSLTERGQDFIKIIFEVFSAFGTVGLSLGITPYLSTAGKLILIMTMLIGRVGPLTIAIIFATKKISGNYRYPEDHIIIG